MLTKEQLNKLMDVANWAGWSLKPVAEVKKQTLDGALHSYAAGVQPEDVVALYDTTAAGNGETGFLLTADAIYSDSFQNARLPLSGLKSVRTVPGKKDNYTVRYQDGSKAVICTYEADQQGLLALLNAAINLEQPASGQTGTATAEMPLDDAALYRDGKARMDAQDWAAGTNYWTQAAELGNTDAMKGLCDFYLLGGMGADNLLIPSSEPYIDPERVIFWGKRAMEHGVDMTTRVVIAYQKKGQYEEAFSFGKQAAADGWKAQWAMMRLCLDLERYEEAVFWGKQWDETWNETRAKDWLEETGTLALQYAATRDKFGRTGEALKYREKAAGLGIPEGMYQLGQMYETGQGTAPNLEKALALYDQAAKYGFQPAAARAEELRASSTPT